jgi:hypothetical protein
MTQGFTRRRLMALLAVAVPAAFPLRAARAQGLNEETSDFGNWRVVSAINQSRAFIIPELLATADRTGLGAATFEMGYTNADGGAYSASLTIDGRADSSQPDWRHTVTLYLDNAKAGSLEATAGTTENVLVLLGGLYMIAAAKSLRADMEIGTETVTVLDLDITGIDQAAPAMAVIPDQNYTPPPETDPNAPSCFLTTACCGLMGLPDDCWELQTLRRFRDEVMLRTPDGRADVARYYQLAPAILRAMREAHQERRLLGVYARYILPSALAARLGFHAAARRRYGAMMAELTWRFLPA